MALLGNQAGKARLLPSVHVAGGAREVAVVVVAADEKKEEEEISCFGRWVPSKVLSASAAAAAVGDGAVEEAAVIGEEGEPGQTVLVGPSRSVAVVTVGAGGTERH